MYIDVKFIVREEMIKRVLVLFCFLNETHKWNVLPMFCKVTDEANKEKRLLCLI